ncbi:MAG TPA: GntR family transcriptional regulator [Bacillota bacterium]|nr:GntR family transcriptional regulator [Bacillota bacterium]
MVEKKQPLYMQIRELLRQEIQKGRWKSGERIPPEMEICKYFNVSRFTVRQAILQLVQEGLLERHAGRGTFIKKARPAGNLREDQQLLGVVLPYQPYAHTGEILKGIEKRASQLGMRAVFANSQHTDNEEQLLQELLQEGVCGLIYYCSELSKIEDIVLMLKEEPVPFVLVDRYPLDIPVDYVATDNFQGSYNAVKHLLGLGYRKIAFVTGEIESSTVRQRVKGYELAHTMAGFAPAPGLSVMSAKREVTELELENILAAQPEAVFTSDLIAVRLMNLGLKKGVSVPQQLAVVGFDNSPIASLVNPPLTTVEQPTEEMGAKAVEIIADKLAGKEAYQQITLPTKLVVRDSCGAIKSEA